MGSVNRYTGALKELFLQAADEVGDRREIGPNGELDGDGGALAFLKVTALTERKTFFTAMARLLPITIKTAPPIKKVLTREEARPRCGGYSVSGVRVTGIDAWGLGCAVRAYARALAERARPENYLGRPQGRPRDPLLPHGKAVQSRTTSCSRIHRRLLSVQSERRFGGLDTGRRVIRLIAISASRKLHLNVAFGSTLSPGADIRPAPGRMRE
jgi:hypothetical protein